MYRITNTTVLHADDDGRYGEFRPDEEDLVIYDREDHVAFQFYDSVGSIGTEKPDILFQGLMVSDVVSMNP